jgi:hypothetical protein
MSRLEAIAGEWDEDGFHLSIDADDDDFVVVIRSVLEARRVLEQVEPLREWVAEHDRELAAYRRRPFPHEREGPT